MMTKRQTGRNASMNWLLVRIPPTAKFVQISTAIAGIHLTGANVLIPN